MWKLKGYQVSNNDLTSLSLMLILSGITLDWNFKFKLELQKINDTTHTGCPKKMSLSKMLRGRIFLNTPSFSIDKMRRI